MLAGPAISGMASGKNRNLVTALGLLFFARGERGKTARVSKDQLNRLQQE
jgi:hypothetical protein